MKDDDVLQQVRAARDEFARSHDYDVFAMVADLREQDRLDAGRVLVSPPPKRPPAPPAATGAA